MFSKDSSYKWALLGYLWVAYFFQQGTRQIYPAVVDSVQKDFNVSSTQIGFVMTMFALAYGITVPFGGIASDLFRRKWMVVGGVFLFCFGIFVAGTVTSLIMMALMYGLLNGVGQSLYYPPASSLLGQFHEKTRSTAFSIHQTALYIGTVICCSVAGYLAELPEVCGIAGWKMPFLLFGAIGMMWAVFLSICLRDTKQQPVNGQEVKVSFKDAAKTILCRPSAVTLTFVFGFMVFVDIGSKMWLPTYLIDNFELTKSSAAFNSTCWRFLGAFIGVLIGGVIIDKIALRGYKPVRFISCAIGYFIAGLIMLAVSQAPSKELCLLGLFAFGLLSGIIDAGIFAALFDVVPPRYRASAMGIMLCGGFVIGSTSAPILGLIRDTSGLSTGIAILCAPYVLNATLLVLARVFFFNKDNATI